MDDKQLAEYYLSGMDLEQLSDADLARLEQMFTPKEGMGAKLWRGADTLGLPESVGGIVGGALGTAAGGPLGTIPGSMSGAALVNAIKNYFQGDSNPWETGGEALLEGAVPLFGKFASKLGGKLVKSSLPITEKAAETANPWARHEGVAKILGDLEDFPGIRPKTVFGNVSEELTDATNLRNQLASSHGDITSGAIPQAAGIGGKSWDIPADIASQIHSSSRFVEGATETGDKLLRDKAFKKALSEELKQQVPGMDTAMGRQSKAIPLKEALDALLTRGGSSSVPFSEVIVSGMKARPLGIVRPPMFSTGRLMQSAGRGMSGPGASTLPRALPGLLELIAEALGDELQPSH